METFYFTTEDFNKQLDFCLTIKETHKDFYICEYVTPALYKKDIKIVITN